MMLRHNLCALNSWHARIPVLPIHWRPGTQGQATARIDKARLIQAATGSNPDGEALQALVAGKLQQVSTADPHELHAQVNAILQQSVQQIFPQQRAADGRVSAQEPFRASARETWRLYAALRRPRVATMAAMIHKWKLHLAFARASRALRQQSRDLKRAAFAAKLAQAEEAASCGDQRTLYQIVRSLAPASSRLFSRLRDTQGNFLTKHEEVRALVAQGKTTYSLHADRPVAGVLSGSIDLTDEEITQQFRKIKAAKAVPSHLAHAAAWKICASSLGPLFGDSLRQHLVQGHAGLLHGDLTDAQMVMLPKAGKSPHILAHLRPIGLMGPPSKAIAGALRNRMLAQLGQLIRFRPQFAYTAERGTLDALFRIHRHVSEATLLVRANRISHFGMHAGRKPLALAGALSLSLDLSRAFDLADRCQIYDTLERHQVPRAVIDVIQRLHTGSRFVYKAGAHSDAFVPTNGLKQGCKIAPCLWVWYTIALFDTLGARLSETWVRHTPTVFADDCWAHWLIRSLEDLQRAVREMQILLCTLEDYKMRINFTKTAILVKLVGKQAAQAMHNYTCYRQGVQHLIVVVNGSTQYIPIKLEHEYLGSKVSYTNGAESNLEHRLQAGQLRYHAIRRALTGLNKWETRALKHLRAILRKPSHLTHVSNDEIWMQARVRKPRDQLLGQVAQVRQKLEAKAQHVPDITTEAETLQYVRGLEEQLQLLIAKSLVMPAPPPPTQKRYECPHCEDTFATEHALKIHCGIRHPAPDSERAREKARFKFDPAVHSAGGLPHCRSCGRKFAKWQFFKHHIEVVKMPGDNNMRPGATNGAGINPETDIFAYVNFTSQRDRQETPPENLPNKRPRPEQSATRSRRNPRQQGGRPSGGGGAKAPSLETVRTLTKIVIRQEDQLAELRGDKGFFLFLKEEPEVSVIPALIQISKDWHARQDAGDTTLQSPLRTLLMACLVRRLRELIVLMTATPESVKRLQTAEWMDQAEEWTFFKWSHQEKKLVRHPERGTIAQPALLEIVDYLLANLKGEVVQKFTSKQKLYEMEEESPTTATFFMSISLRGPVAQKVHECLVQLIGVSALMLVGASLKREIPRRSPMVQQLAEAVFR
ncbi:pol [Symbiodinium necroappetens]|uniref:Pol protein n=1 Tax=Symbiodinium necroappetens TaxID=1628268 RepID=A0A812X0S3_9DINO|nr:pol [Symbiodinium necroappetens]